MYYITEINWGFILIITLLCLLLSYYVSLKQNKKVNLIMIGIDSLYILILFSLLFTASFTYSTTITYQLIPFKSIIEYINKGSLKIFEYIIISIPIPILLCLNFKTLNNKKCLLYSFFIVLLFEPIQLLLNIMSRRNYRIINIDDCLLYMIGCFVGSFFVLIIRRMRVIK